MSMPHQGGLTTFAHQGSQGCVLFQGVSFGESFDHQSGFQIHPSVLAMRRNLQRVPNSPPSQWEVHPNRFAHHKYGGSRTILEDLMVQLTILLVRMSLLFTPIAIIAKGTSLLMTMVLISKVSATIAKGMLPNRQVLLHMGTISHHKNCFIPKVWLRRIPQWVPLIK